MQLRKYQIELLEQIRGAWTGGAHNVLAVLPTGAGKTVIFTRILAEHPGPSIAIAHRHELVGQISVALGRHGVRHRIIGAKETIKHVIKLQTAELGRSFYDPLAPCGVASVDTLVRRRAELGRWLSSITLWVQDEAHHVLRGNKWGKAAAMAPGAVGLGVTATPTRADGKGLGRDADGLFDAMVEGPTMREIIGIGFLTDYRIFAPTTADLRLEDVPTSSATGDFVAPALRSAVRRSRIVGDVVDHYKRHAGGKLGITFAVDVENAVDIATAYNAASVPAEVVSYKTDDRTRSEILRRFRAREILQLVNVDLFGEGFDLPAVEVVSFARPTQSYALYAQQFGRSLRILEGKGSAVIIDHVGNVVRHGLPDAARVWTLDRRDRRATKDPDVLPVRACPACTGVFERIYRVCPYCGHEPVPANRSDPEYVDGDLLELDAGTLARMRGDVERATMSPADYHRELITNRCPAVGVGPNLRRYESTLTMRNCVRWSIGYWVAEQRGAGRPDSEIYRRFFYQFGVDVLTAQTLDRAGSRDLANRINSTLGKGTK